VIGTMKMDDWKWNADLAFGPGSCTTMPQPKQLARPVCYLPEEECSRKAPTSKE